MTWSDIVPLLTQTGVFSAVAWVAYRLHRDSVQAHKDRADDRQLAAQREAASADERERQLGRVLDAVTARTAGTS